jgi:hypothetical protein
MKKWKEENKEKMEKMEKEHKDKGPKCNMIPSLVSGCLFSYIVRVS